MWNCFIGWDHRQPIAYAIAHFSLVQRASCPVTVAPLNLEVLSKEGVMRPDQVGLTPFTFSRWLVPHLMGHEGWALFMDADVLVLGDVAEIFGLRDENYAVQVVKHKEVFEWSSVMLFNCSHEANKALTPEHVAGGKPYKWDWLGGSDSGWIGELPKPWNHLVGYDPVTPDQKLIHYTAGIPPFPETEKCEYAEEWRQEHQAMNSAMSWMQLMGPSVHAVHLPDGRVLPKGHPDVIAMEAA